MGWFNHQPDQCSLCSRCFFWAMKWWNVLSMTALSAQHWPDVTPNDKFRLFSTGGQRRYFIHSNSHIEVGGSWWKVIFVPGTVRIIRPASNWDCDDGKGRYYIYIVYLPACLHTCIHTYIQTIKMQVTWTLMVDPQLTAMTYKGVVTVITVIYVHDVQSCSLLFGVMFLFLLAIRGCFENCSSSALTSRYTIYGIRYKQEQLLQRRHHHVFVLCFVGFKELIKWTCIYNICHNHNDFKVVVFDEVGGVCFFNIIPCYQVRSPSAFHNFNAEVLVQLQ